MSIDKINEISTYDNIDFLMILNVIVIITSYHLHIINNGLEEKC